MVEIDRGQSVTSVSPFAFDHVSIGVRDADNAARTLRKVFGSTPISGEQLPNFRYVLNRMGSETEGMQVEFIQPWGAKGFVQRFLDDRGEGVHHLTFTVPDVSELLPRLRALGLHVVQVQLDYPPWREIFIHPSQEGFGVLIQIADSTLHYPSMSQLLKCPVVDPAAIPHNQNGKDRHWWVKARNETTPGETCWLRRVELSTTRLPLLDHLFVTAMGADAREVGPETMEYRWSSAVIRAKQDTTSRITALVFEGPRQEPFSMGTAEFISLGRYEA